MPERYTKESKTRTNQYKQIWKSKNREEKKKTVFGKTFVTKRIFQFILGGNHRRIKLFTKRLAKQVIERQEKNISNK